MPHAPLCSTRIDTVKQMDSWSRSPYVPVVEDDFIYGLGSNDCGGGLVALLQVYRHLTSEKQNST